MYFYCCIFCYITVVPFTNKNSDDDRDVYSIHFEDSFNKEPLLWLLRCGGV